MGTHEGGADDRLPPGHGRIHRRQGKHPGLEQGLGKLEGFFVRADDDGDDGRGRIADAKADVAIGLPHAHRDFVEPVHPFGLALQDVQAGQHGHGVGRRQGGGKNLGARLVAHVAHHVLVVRGDKAADGGHGLAERAHDEIDLVRDAEMIGHAATAPAEHAQAMGVVQVEHDVGMVLLDGDQLVQDGQFTGHAEHALGDEKHVAVGPGGLGLGHALGGMGGVVMGEGGQPGLGVLDALENAGMVFPVADHGVGRGDQGAERPHVGAETRDVDHGIALAHEGGQPFLQLVVQHHVAAQKARAAGPGAPFVHGLGRRIHDAGVMAQAEVVVGADHDQTLAAHFHLGAPGLGDGTEVGMNALGRYHGLQGLELLATFGKSHGVSFVPSAWLGRRGPSRGRLHRRRRRAVAAGRNPVILREKRAIRQRPGDGKPAGGGGRFLASRTWAASCPNSLETVRRARPSWPGVWRVK